MKTYFGSTQTTENYFGNIPIGDNGITKGDDPTPPVSPIDPESISGLLIYADAVRSAVYTSGTDVTGVQNRGSLGGNFNPYPAPASFNPALVANFLKGSGSTKYFEFKPNTTNHCYTLYLDTSVYGRKTTISIAKIVSQPNFALAASPRMWNHANTSFALYEGITHPLTNNSTTMDGYAFGNTVTPDNPLSSYVVGNTDYNMFAWTSEPSYAGALNSKFQTQVGNSTSATYTGAGTINPINQYFINDCGGSTNPAGGWGGTQNHIAHMVYDSVLTEAQINGIYNYYNVTRGYPMV